MFEEAPLQFSEDELLLLSLKLGMPLKGMDYSSVFRLCEGEMKDAWNTYKKALAGKGYIGEESEDNLEVDLHIIKFLKSCYDSSNIFVLQISEHGKLKELINYYMNDEVFMIEKSLDHSQFKVYRLGNLTATENHLRDILSQNASSNTADGVSAVSLSESQYYRFMAFVNMGEKQAIVDLFSFLGMDELMALDSVDGFMDKKYGVSLSYLRSDQSIEQLFFYKGEKYLWGVRFGEDPDEFVQISLTSPDEIFLAIQSIMSQVRESL